jgi:hypothetical protein
MQVSEARDSDSQHDIGTNTNIMVSIDMLLNIVFSLKNLQQPALDQGTKEYIER